MRKKRLFWNTAGSLGSEITGIISGLILPVLILRQYGSEVNGLIQSITGFLSVIAFLDLGVGRVVESSLYAPLASRDFRQVSRIVASAARFFRQIGVILAVYVAVLCFVYPALVRQSFDFLYTVTLILILSVSSFSEYFFSLTDSRLLNADQHLYVLHGTNILSQLISLIVSVILIRLNCPIRTLKLVVTVLCLWRPVFLRIYVNRHYPLDRGIRYEGEPIRDKWYGIAQHIEFSVLKNTDHLVLTLFSSLENVSIYSIYYMILSAMGKLIRAFRGGFLALFGELWAKGEREELQRTFSWFEWIIHTITILLYGCTTVLIVPFVQVYTCGISDADYTQPLFALLLTAASAFECLQMPYHMMILAAGHYKETQRCYIITAILNLGISIPAVVFLGLPGVAAGTLISLVYQTIWMAAYSTRHLVTLSNPVKRVIADLLMIVTGLSLTFRIRMNDTNYGSWLLAAIQIGLLWTIVVLGVNILFYPDRLKKALKPNSKKREL